MAKSGHTAGCGVSALTARNGVAAQQPGFAPADQRPAVEPVGERAAVQPEHHERHQLHHAEQANRQRRPGELLGLHEQRDLGGLRSEPGDCAAGEQQPDIPPAVQRRQVGQQPGSAHPATVTMRDERRPLVFRRYRASSRKTVVGAMRPADVERLRGAAAGRGRCARRGRLGRADVAGIGHTDQVTQLPKLDAAIINRRYGSSDFCVLDALRSLLA